MTVHFNEFEGPAGLEESCAEQDLPELTGCPIHKRIDAGCTEPDCPNNPANRLRALLPILARKTTTPSVFQTEAKLRCIL